MNNEEYSLLRRQLPSLRTELVDSEFGLVVSSIPYLLQLLEVTKEEDFKRLLYSDLAAEALHMRNFDLSLYFRREQCKEFSDDPVCYSALAYALASQKTNDPAAKEESIIFGKKALHLAIEQKRMVKWCGCYLARIALLVDDYTTLHLAISELLADAVNRHREDYEYEFDFVDKIDPRRFDTEMLFQYKALKQIKGTSKGSE